MLTKQILLSKIWFLLFMAVLLPIRVSAETTYDFTSTLPTGVTASQVEISNGHLQLTQDSSSHFVSSGHIDIPISAADVGGKLIKLSTQRTNMIVNGDFSDTTLNTIYKYTGSSSYRAKTTGYWFAPSTKPNIIDQSTTGTPDYAVQMLRRQPGIVQFVPILPGEDYTLSYDLDASNLAQTSDDVEQTFQLSIGFLDSSFHMLNFYDSYRHEPVCTSFPCPYPYFLAKINDNDDSGVVRFRIRTLDCDTHTQYVGGTANYASDVTFNFCKKDDGSNMETLDDSGNIIGAYSGASDIAYMAIYFKSSWVGTSAETQYDSNYGVADDINLDLEDQIQVDILDASGNVLQSSTLDHGFYVEPTTQAATLRLNLKSHRTEASPTVSTLTIADGLGLTVTAGDQIASYTETRMESTGEVPPDSEYDDLSRTTLRSLCVDPEDGVAKDCFELHRDYNMDSTRDSFLFSYLEPVWSESDNDYTFRIAPVYEDYFKYREQERLDKGISIASMLVGDHRQLFNMSGDNYESFCASVDTSNTCCYDDQGQRRYTTDIKVCYAHQFPDLNSPTTRTDTEQAEHLVSLATKYIVNLYNDTTYTFTDGTTHVFPKVMVFEGWPEVNTPTQTADPYESGVGSLTPDEYIDLQNQVAAAVREARPDAQVTTPSVLVNEVGAPNGLDHQSIDMVYALASLTQWNKDNFTAYALHPYINYDSRHPEELWEDWAELEIAMTAAGWNDYPVYTTEWGYKHEIYDPYCNVFDPYNYSHSGNTIPDFDRGYGEEEFAKRVARQQLVHLGLPLPKSHYYAEFSNELEAGGRNITAGERYDCWRSDHVVNFSLWERQEGSGILSGHDEPTVYEANLGGKAYLTIAKHVSVSSPYASTVSLSAEDSAENEHYYSVLLKGSTAGTYYLGLWWYKDFWYTPDKPFFNDTYGTYDDGFTEKRIHDVTLSGFSAVSSAMFISLTDGSEQSLSISTRSDPIVNGVVFGEMPILVKITGLLAAEDVDGDGIANTSDNCTNASNTDQIDTDSDGQGDSCDTDDDDDGSLDSDDCSPLVVTVYPGAREICNSIDDDCDGSTDESAYGAFTYYTDGDGDGFGKSGTGVNSCTPIIGTVRNKTDCDDTNAAINPLAAELCSTTYDDNCNGMANEPGAPDASVFYRDDDSDTYGLDSSTVKACVKPPFHYATQGGDCDDTTSRTNPGRNEICDNVDNNCNGRVDEPSRFSSNTYFPDRDRDTYGDSASSVRACSLASLPPDYVARGKDCLDTNPIVNPRAIEVCGDSIDNDCDGHVDEGCPTTTTGAVPPNGSL